MIGARSRPLTAIALSLRAPISGTDCAAATQNAKTFEYADCGPNDPAPARDAGLRPGDEIVSIDGVATPTWSDVVARVQKLRGEHDFVVLRDGAERTITIRGEPHTVLEAIHRQLTHYAYHVGQIVLLAKHRAGGAWTSLSIPKGKSAEYEVQGAAWRSQE